MRAFRRPENGQCAATRRQALMRGPVYGVADAGWVGAGDGVAASYASVGTGVPVATTVGASAVAVRSTVGVGVAVGVA